MRILLSNCTLQSGTLRPTLLRTSKAGDGVVFRSRITARQMGAGIAAIFALLLFTQPCLAGGDDHRALQLLLKKGIITQQEYDEAVREEDREEQREKQANTITKHGLEFKLGGFAEIDFIEDNTRSFQETIGDRPVLRSNTLAGANSQFQASPRNSRIRIDVQAPERDGINARFHTSFDFLGNQPAVGTSGVSEFSAVTSPVARIFKMYFHVETPVVDNKDRAGLVEIWIHV